METLDTYKKLYTFLVSEIDETLTLLENGRNTKEVLLYQIYSKLQRALLQAEEMYISADSERNSDG